jgi:SanA protein
MPRWNISRKMVMWFLVIVGLCVVAFAGFFLYVERTVLRAAKGRIYTMEHLEKIPHTRVALVLGARVYPDGRLSAVLKDRVDTAIALYKAGKVDKLLMSGDNRSAKYNEVSAMRNYAVKNGIPSDDVVRDFAGFRTYDSVYRAKEIWGLDRIIIVTQPFHLPRSLYIAKNLGMDAIGVASTEQRYSTTPRLKIRERGAWLLAWVDVMVGRDPYFLGPRESLSGDDQQTQVPE